MDVYIYTLDLTEEEPEIEITLGQAVKLFDIGNYIEYNIERSIGPNDKEILMHGLSNRELNIPFFSTNKKSVFLVATDDSNEFDNIDKIFRFCEEEFTKLLKKAKQLVRGMTAVNNKIKEISHGTVEQD